MKPRWSHCSEEQLIEACARGDGEALGELFDRHHLAVHRFVSRLSGTNRSDLDDLVQNWRVDKRWEPRWNAEQRDAAYAGWQKAVQRTLNWV